MARKRGVDRAQVVDAAVVLVERDGLAALTLAGVAEVLDVRSPSLYSHVDGLAGLRRAVALEAVRRLGAAMAEATADVEGTDAVRALAGAYRSFAVAHPGLYAAMLPVPQGPDDPEGYAAFAAPVDVVARVLAGLAVPAADSVGVIRAFRSALHGFVSLEVGGGFGMPLDVDESFELLVDVLIAGVLARSTSVRWRRDPAG